MSSSAKSSGSLILAMVLKVEGDQQEAFIQHGMTIGRAISNTICIDSPDVEPIHARVLRNGDGKLYLQAETPTARIELMDGSSVWQIGLGDQVRFKIGPMTLVCIKQQSHTVVDVVVTDTPSRVQDPIYHMNTAQLSTNENGTPSRMWPDPSPGLPGKPPPFPKPPKPPVPEPDSEILSKLAWFIIYIILVCAAGVTACALSYYASEISGDSSVGLLAVCVLVLGTTIWATIDALRLKTNKYVGYNGAIAIFIACLVMWVLVFPYYLIKRRAIVNGTAQLRQTGYRAKYSQSAPVGSGNVETRATKIKKTGSQQPQRQKHGYQRKLILLILIIMAAMALAAIFVVMKDYLYALG